MKNWHITLSMFSRFFSGTPEAVVERNYLKDLIHYCEKRLRQDRDLLSKNQEMAFRKEIQKAQNSFTAKEPHPLQVGEALEEACRRCFLSVEPPWLQKDSHSGWLRENGEVILVAMIVAFAVRAFFFQPFKIPTGSMQPTLNGITIRATKPHELTWWYRLICRPLFGERVVHLVVEEEGSFNGMQAVKFGPLHYGGKNGFFNWFPTEATEFTIGSKTYTFPTDTSKFQSDVLRSGVTEPGSQPLLNRGRTYQKDEVLLSCVIQTGDQLFVDRCTYHFRKPKRGDVFVFETDDLKVINPGQFYIKRLAGVPNDTLEIKERNLYLNGQLAEEPGFQKVMSQKDGYRGYGYLSSDQRRVDGLEGPFSLGDREYFALGDNSFNSADSRFWGTVPYKNIVGRGFFVYWPFTRHFGRVD